MDWFPYDNGPRHEAVKHTYYDYSVVNWSLMCEKVSSNIFNYSGK